MAPRKPKKESAKEKRKREYLRKYFPDMNDKYLKRAKFWVHIPKSCALFYGVLKNLEILKYNNHNKDYINQSLQRAARAFTALYKMYPSPSFHDINKVIRRRNDRFKLQMLEDRRFKMQINSVLESDKESSIVEVEKRYYILRDYDFDQYSQRIVQHHRSLDVTFRLHRIEDLLNYQEEMKKNHEIQQTIEEHPAFDCLNHDVKTTILQFL